MAHEYTRGITNRMTGGGTGRCLQAMESQGLGEGWSDSFAEWLTHTDASVPDWFTGQWVTNSAAGVRTHPYSTNPATNPLRYSNLQTLTEVHAIREVWANILHNVYAALVAAHGFSTNGHFDSTTTGGNTIFLHLFMDALSIQPCNPTFGRSRFMDRS